MRSDIYITKSTKLAISHGSPDTMDPVESEFRESLERIAPKCQTSAETEYVATLQKVAKSILSESEESKSSPHHLLCSKVQLFTRT